MRNVSPFTKEGYMKMHKVTSGKIVTQTIILNVIALLLGIIFIIRQQYVLGGVTLLVMISFSIVIPLNRHIKIKKLMETGIQVGNIDYIKGIFKLTSSIPANAVLNYKFDIYDLMTNRNFIK